MDPATTQTTAAGASSGQTKDDKYNVPQVVLDKYPELVELIKKTESMSVRSESIGFRFCRL